MKVLHKTPEQSEQEMVASMAVLLYEPADNRLRGYTSTAFATVHDIEVKPVGKGKDLGAPELLPGRLLDRATLATMVQKLSGSSGRRREMLPTNLLHFDEGRMVWHTPTQTRPIWFRTGRKEFDNTVNGREVLHPPLLFTAEPGHLYVLALNSDRRPNPGDIVYRAPYYNLYNPHGHMCNGNVRLPDRLDWHDFAIWEAAFFETQFTHSNYGGAKICLHPSGHDGLWRAMRFRQEWRGFPPRFLAPCVADGKASGRILTVEEVIAR